MFRKQSREVIIGWKKEMNYKINLTNDSLPKEFNHFEIEII